MKKICLIMMMLAMIVTSTGMSSAFAISIKAEDSKLKQDVKIELLQNDVVVESDVNELTHTRNYMRSNTKTNGDQIVIKAPKGVHYLMVQLDTYCGTPKMTGQADTERVEGTVKPSNMNTLEYEEVLIYVMNDEFRFVIPGLTGTNASGTTLGGGNWPYDARAFSTSGNTEKKITARVATEEEINTRRNLALNPYDLQGNDNGLSASNKKGDSNVFPHAYANRVTDNKREFEPRNAIDGFEYNASHVGFPYQAWGCGNEKTDSEFSVLFGRYVDIDQVDITVRAQWNPPQPNNANDHDINWASATLEFSDGTEIPITLKKLASPQTIQLPEHKIVSWVRLKDLPVSEEIIPVDGRKKFSALTEFKVWGTETKDDVEIPSGEKLVNLAKKVNDYWIKTGGNTGTDATNYNHGHSVTNEFWASSVFYTGNMEAYYLTGDENYTDYANRWGSNNIYNNSAWNTNGGTGRTGKYFPDNHTSFQTYMDMFSITSDVGYNTDDEKLKNLVLIMNEMEKMSINDLKSKGYWDRIDFFFMELPNWTKMYLLTGEQKWLDKLRELYDDRKEALYDEESGLFYRDTNYLFDANAVYNPNGDGNNQKISPNGKKILWSRGNGWAMAALAKVLQDLPDDRASDREEYEAVFKKMASTLIQVQGEDGFWRMNLDDYDHDIRPESSGTLFFAYGLTWGINHGLLDKETYDPSIQKAFHGLNAKAIRPDGLVGRSELISAYPNPKCSLGIGSSQSYAPAAAVLFLSELSKMKQQGYVTDDIEPALNKKMVGSIAIKTDSKYAIVNSKICELSKDGAVTAIKQDDKVYVPKDFIKEVYGEKTANDISDTITQNDVTYVALSGVLDDGSNRILSTLNDDLSIISYKAELFNPIIDAKLVELLNVGLTEGHYPKRPEYPIRFDYTEVSKQPEPSKDALVAGEANSNGAVSVSRQMGPNTEKQVNVEFDMVSTLSPSQTNAIVGIGDTDSAYTSYTQVPIIIRMYKDGYFSAYNGNTYVQSSLRFTQNEKYHIRTTVDLETNKYSIYVTAPGQEEVQIVKDFAFRSSAAKPKDIGKIYLFNNEQPAGKYWLEDIYLGKHVDKLTPSKNAIISTEANSTGSVSASKNIGPSNKSPVNIEFDMVTMLSPKVTNAIVGIGEADSNYGAYNQYPIIIRMFNDGTFGAYNGKGYVQSKVTFDNNKKYHLRISIDIETKKYSAYVTASDQEEVSIATDFAFRSTAIAPPNIGKIYLINNDQEAGNYWLDDIHLSTMVNKADLEIILLEVKAIKGTDYTEDSYQVLQEAIQNGDMVLADQEAVQEEIDHAIDVIRSAIDNLQKAIISYKEILRNAINKTESLMSDDTFIILASKVQTMIYNAYEHANVVMNNDSATQPEILNAWSKLALALHYADFIADKTDLELSIKAYDGLKEEDYVAGFDAFKIAMQEAKNVYADDNALQNRIDDANTALLNAYKALVKTEDIAYKTLSELVELFKEIETNASKYCNNNAWKAFIIAMEEAQVILSDHSATASQIHKVILTLTNAYEDIRLLPHEDILNSLKAFVEKVENLDWSIYQADQTARIIAVSGNARMMLHDPDTFDPIILEEIAQAYNMLHEQSQNPESDSSTSVDKRVSSNTAITSNSMLSQMKNATHNGITRTGDTTSIMSLFGITLLSGIGLYAINKKRKLK